MDSSTMVLFAGLYSGLGRLLQRNAWLDGSKSIRKHRDYGRVLLQSLWINLVERIGEGVVVIVVVAKINNQIKCRDAIFLDV